jgi:hypothetical protein
MAGFLLSWAASILPTQLGGSESRASAGEPETEGELIISKLVVYPIKSCAGIEMEASPYSITGLQYDRNWMLVDTNTKKMVTARTHAKVGCDKEAYEVVLSG